MEKGQKDGNELETGAKKIGLIIWDVVAIKNSFRIFWDFNPSKELKKGTQIWNLNKEPIYTETGKYPPVCSF